MRELVRRLLERTSRLAEVPAPTFAEQARAELVAGWWVNDGIRDMRTDEAGNLIGCVRRGSGSRPLIMVCAHLDTVFPVDVQHGLRQEGSRLIGPSVADDSVAVAALSLMNEALARDVSLPVWIAATTAEEGLGNLAGVTHMLDQMGDTIGVLIALEGNYLGRVNTRGVGSVRVRIDLLGRGGHSWEEPSNPSAIESSLTAIDKVLSDHRALISRPGPRCTVNVGRIRGGEAINSRAKTCSFDLEIRSASSERLTCLEQVLRERVSELSEDFDVQWTELGRRPAGEIVSGHPVVESAAAALRQVGINPKLTEASTDANAAYQRGIPAVTLGLAFGGDTHTESEWLDIDSLELGFEALCRTVERLAKEGW